ncbi:pantoate kinase [Haloferax sp. Q22]|uniref:pantoate kinase n=1 Tax=Haloferax sp. (strain Q22) TaxID=1526048 RepID=UPI000737CDDF|nr:pantoate kinase [Haloferax sp. Q22]
MSDDATAFVPGHVTGFFSAHPADDPATAGSRGAGLTLSHGVTVTVEPAQETTVTLDGEAVEMPPVADVLRSLGVTAAVDAESDLPLGAGFGVSGAMALGAALASNAVFSRGRSENELVTLAHVAEVRAETGLGDVVAQARGGMPIRVEPGAPAHGRMDGVPARPEIEYVAFGGLSTADVLSGDTTALTTAGEAALEALRAEPTLDRFVVESRRFARDADLLTDRVEAAVDDVRAAGGDGSMAMLGETVFAVGSGLSDAGYDPERCRVHPAGATLLSE